MLASFTPSRIDRNYNGEEVVVTITFHLSNGESYSVETIRRKNKMPSGWKRWSDTELTRRTAFMLVKDRFNARNSRTPYPNFLDDLVAAAGAAPPPPPEPPSDAEGVELAVADIRDS